MAEQPDTLTVLIRVATETEASLAVLRLGGLRHCGDRGGRVHRRVLPAPGLVAVMVKSADLPAAEAALDEIEKEPSDGRAAGQKSTLAMKMQRPKTRRPVAPSRLRRGPSGERWRSQFCS